MTKKDKFKDRYVLAEGYPYVTLNNWFIMYKRQDSANDAHVTLVRPEEFESMRLPKYRLVLERINPKKEKK